jgi:hypothetical protein
MLWGVIKFERICTVVTVRENFNDERQENKNLILAIVLCRNFICYGTNRTVLIYKKRQNIQIYCFLRKLMYTGGN